MEEIDYKEAYEKEHIKCADLAGRIADLEEQNEELSFKLGRIKNNPLWKASKPARDWMHWAIRQKQRLTNCGGPKGVLRKIDYKKREKEAMKHPGGSQKTERDRLSQNGENQHSGTSLEQ